MKSLAFLEKLLYILQQVFVLSMKRVTFYKEANLCQII